MNDTVMPRQLIIDLAPQVDDYTYLPRGVLYRAVEEWLAGGGQVTVRGEPRATKLVELAMPDGPGNAPVQIIVTLAPGEEQGIDTPIFVMA